MKERFIPKRFGSGKREIIDKANEICQEYAAQGFDLSVRQLFYQFVSQNLVANTPASYNRLKDTISEARLAGELDWNFITDRGRETVANPHWNSPADILVDAAESYHVDMWRNQDDRVIVMVEKQALEGVLIPVCRELDVPFCANKGYSSTSALYEVAQLLRKIIRIGKIPHVLYLGDHDPSGLDMTRDVEHRLELFTRRSIHVRRIALTMSQIHQFNLPENHVKDRASRAENYKARFGRESSSWELDALEPSVLVDIVRKEVLFFRNEERYQQLMEEQEAERARLFAIADDFDARA